MVVKITKGEAAGQKPAKDEGLFGDMDRAAKRRSCLSCGNCAIALILGLVLIALGLASVVAATGLVRIPVLSGVVYKTPPAPTRLVEPSGPTNASELVIAKLQDPQVLKTRQLSVTEAELTQILRDPGSDGEVLLKQGQVAIDAGRAELYGQVTVGGNPLVIAIELEPTSAVQGLAVTSITLGRVPIPKTMTDLVTRTLLDMLASQMRLAPGTTLADVGIEKLNLTPGTLTVTVGRELLQSLQGEGQ